MWGSAVWVHKHGPRSGSRSQRLSLVGRRDCLRACPCCLLLLLNGPRADGGPTVAPPTATVPAAPGGTRPRPQLCRSESAAPAQRDAAALTPSTVTPTATAFARNTPDRPCRSRVPPLPTAVNVALGARRRGRAPPLRSGTPRSPASPAGTPHPSAAPAAVNAPRPCRRRRGGGAAAFAFSANRWGAPTVTACRFC